MITPAYKIGTPLAEIILDGWARGFKVPQTMEEAESMGYEVTEEEIIDAWEYQDKMFRVYLHSVINKKRR